MLGMNEEPKLLGGEHVPVHKYRTRVDLGCVMAAVAGSGLPQLLKVVNSVTM